MTDSTGLLSDAASADTTETQLAQAGDAVVVTDPPAGGSTSQVVAPGDSLQLNFDPADVATAEIKDGNLEITFENGGVAVIEGYEQWAAAGGQPAGPQGGAVDIAQLGQGAAAPATGQAATEQAADEPSVCEIPNANVVDVPVPAAGERLSVAVQPGDVIRLNCSFQDIAGAEVGDTLEMTFPGGGIVVVENFSAWIAAQGATVTDCVCGGLNLAEFIVAMGMSPEDVIPAAGDSGGPGGDADLTGSGFTPGPGPQILTGLPYPNILPPTGLGYGLPEPDDTFFPIDEDDDGRPDARDDPPNAIKDILTVHEDTQPLQVVNFAAAALILDPDDVAPPRGPEEFKQDSTSIDVLPNDSFGPDGDGGIIDFQYIGDDPTTTTTVGAGQITVTDDEGVWEAILITEGPDRGKFTFNLLETYEHEEGQGANSAFEEFQYTIADKDGDTDSAKVTVQIVDDVPVAENDFTVFVTEGGEGGQPPEASQVTGNVLANDDKGADQFLPDGTFVTSIKYTDEDGVLQEVEVPQDGSPVTVNTEHGTLTIDKLGDWTYVSDDSVEHNGAPEEDLFTYTITDGDGDTSTAEQLIIVEDVVEPPSITLSLPPEVDCIEEDSTAADADNQVTINASANGDDVLTTLVITGFPTSGWVFDISDLTTAETASVSLVAGTLTIVFNPGVTSYIASFGVQPPPDSDVDLGTLDATLTAAAGDGSGLTADASASVDIHVDANADPVTVSLDVNDSGDAGDTFGLGESGTVTVTATFGDTGDGSEDHTVVVTIPDGFTVGDLTGLPAGVTAVVNGDGDVEFTVANDVPQFSYAIPVTNTSAGEGEHVFEATAVAEETNTDDEECDPSEADNIAVSEDSDTAVVRNVGAPTVSILVGVDGTCLEEDSQTSDVGNIVHLTASAQAGDVLTQLVIEGFDPATAEGSGGEQATWIIDIAALNAHADVASAVYDTATDTLTITFEPGVTTFTGDFGIAPPANTDVDLGELTATVTAADSVDPSLTATGSDTASVTVDANADPVSVTLNVNDSGDAGTTFQQNEIGTVQVTASFGDFQDGSEIHTVLVNVPDGFTVGILDDLPDGVTAQIVDGNDVLFTVAQGTAGFDYTFTVINTAGGNGPATFSATATADENPPTDVECDPSDEDNIATDVAFEEEQKEDDTPVIDPDNALVEDDDLAGGNDEGDPPTDVDTRPLNVDFGVDAPGTVVFDAVQPAPGITSRGDAISYTVSADGQTITATADGRTVFTVQLNGTDSYTFTLMDVIDHPVASTVEDDFNFDFNVTATDQDGDSTGASFTVTVNDDVPISTGGATQVVDEDDLPDGSDTTPESLTVTGSFGISFGADGPGDITNITGPAGLTSGGVGITYSAFDPVTNSITASAGGETIFTVSFDPVTGQYSFTLSGPLDHVAGGEDLRSLNFSFTATDGDNDPVNGSFTVNVRDDVPTAVDDTADAAANIVNIVIIFDRSGSMDEDPGVDGFTTRIDLARAAVASMLAAYESVANINIMIVDFAADANNSGWLGSAFDANAYLAGLDANGTTNYNAAIQETMANYNSGLPPADQTFVYFLSDGKPNPSTTSLDASGTVDDWENFLTDEEIDEAFAVGIGEGVDDNDGDLSDIAFPNDDPDNVVIVTDESQVFDALVATVNVQASGNVLTDGVDDTFGADGPGSPQIVSIVVNVQGVGLTTFTYDGTQITNNMGLPVTLGATLLVITSLGGELTFDFGNGDYSYAAGTDGGGQEQFTYTIADGDGDTDSAVLTINLDDLEVEQPNRVFGTDGNDAALTGSSGIDVIGGGDGNDNISANGGDDHISGGSGADTIQGGAGNDVIVGGNQGEATDQPGVVRTGGADLGDVIDGGEGNDVIFGNEGADSLSGGAGNDTIFAGDGGNADTIAGGQGDDVINLAGGGNDVVLYTSTLDGHDVINSFDANDTGGTDVLNLDALFDSLEAALGPLDAAARAARVQIVGSGTTTVEINVNTDGDATFDLNVATLNTTDTSAVNVGQEVIVV
jgi:T1SS-143 domain-containing protein